MAPPSADRPDRSDPRVRLASVPAASRPHFAHNAEEQLAALLDFYGVAWTYEPRTFVLATGDDGQPTAAFTPDFHLTDHDLYVEVTTLDQRLVTKKNRKARQVMERFPGTTVQILYQRDERELRLRFGWAAPQQRAGGAEAMPVTPAAEGLGLLGLGPTMEDRDTAERQYHRPA